MLKNVSYVSPQTVFNDPKKTPFWEPKPVIYELKTSFFKILISGFYELQTSVLHT